MMKNDPTLLKEVCESRDALEGLKLPAVETLTKITMNELAEIALDFSFSQTEMSVQNPSKFLMIDVNGVSVVVFGDEGWTNAAATSYLGFMITLPALLNAEVIQKFNEETRCGRLVTMTATNFTVLRHDLHLDGGVSRRFIYEQIVRIANTAIEFSKENLFRETAAMSS